MTDKALVEALEPFARAESISAGWDGKRVYAALNYPIGAEETITLSALDNAKAALASSGNATGDDKGLERAWRDGFNDARRCVSDDVAFELTEDVEQDTWLDSETRLTALSSGNEVAKVVGWLRSLDRDEWYPSDVADAIIRGDHLASDAAPLTGGGGNG